jgi:hypothetical protein
MLPPDAFEPPGSAGLPIGCHDLRPPFDVVVQGRHGKMDDVVGGRVVPDLTDEPDELAELGHRIATLAIEERKRTVPARRPAEGGAVGPVAADPDRNPGRLDRRRQEPGLADAVVAPLERERLPAPEPREDREPLVEHGGADPEIGLLAEGAPLRLASPRAAEPCAEHETPRREVIQRDRLAGDLPGSSTRERGDERADPQSGGSLRNGREGDPGVGDRGRPVPVHVVPDEEAVPSGLLGVARELGEEERVAERAEVGEVESVPHRVTRAG